MWWINTIIIIITALVGYLCIFTQKKTLNHLQSLQALDEDGLRANWWDLVPEEDSRCLSPHHHFIACPAGVAVDAF